MDSPQTAPSLALAAFSEDLIKGRRVVVFGNSLSGLAETLVERGARLIHVYDEEPARVAEAAARSTSASVSFAPLAPGGIAARDGAFDVGFVEEVSSFSDASQLITRLRRALSARGVGFVCTGNPDVPPLWQAANQPPVTKGPLSYYELYDLVATQFDEVRMVGQTPFAGYALADFSPDTESEFSIDTGFVPGGAEEPERYVAVCSHFPISIEPFCVVQMEAAALVGRSQLPDLAAIAAKTTAADSAVAASIAQLAEAREALTSERAAKAKLEQLLRDVNDELKRRDEWVSELESRATTADERADAAESALERLNAKHKARAEEPRPARDTTQVTQLAQQVSDKSEELRERERTLQELSRKLEDHEQASAANAAQLEGHKRQVTQLQRELALAQHAKTLAEAARDEARNQVATLEREAETRGASEAELTELQTAATELREQIDYLRSDLRLAGGELEQAEQQLIARGLTVRQLQADLADTERFAALLLAQSATDAEVGVTVEKTATQSTPALVLEVEAVDDIPSLATTSLSERAAAEVAPTSTPGDETRALADARAREAELQAALQATRWTVEELEARLAQKSNEQELIERLYRAEHQLQRQATLIAQYERGSRATPAAD